MSVAALDAETDDQMLKRLLDTRYSCRAFLDRPVPEPVISRILEIANRTQSGTNAQPWQILIASGEALRRFGEAAVAATEAGMNAPDYPMSEHAGVYLQRRRECGFGLYAALGIERSDHQARMTHHLKNLVAFGAPHLAIVTTDAPQGPFGAMDCGAYMAVFSLACRAMGVDAITQGAFAPLAPMIREHFGLGPDRLVLAGISFGYGDPDDPANAFRTSRAPLEEIVTFVR